MLSNGVDEIIPTIHALHATSYLAGTAANERMKLAPCLSLKSSFFKKNNFFKNKFL